jgi:hypothetical protein
LQDEAGSELEMPSILEAESEFATQLAEPASAAQAIVDAEALNIAKAALVGSCDYFPWVGPLLEAVALGAKPGARFITSWGGTSSGCEPRLDPEKHAAYVEHVRRTIGKACAWLVPLLDSAGAMVNVGPGVFCFVVSHRTGVVFDIPQLQQLTRLTPWAEPGETMH